MLRALPGNEGREVGHHDQNHLQLGGLLVITRTGWAPGDEKSSNTVPTRIIIGDV